MFRFGGCFLLKVPSGKYTFVGSVPLELCGERKPTYSDIMGGRLCKNAKGKVVAWTEKVFDTEQAARLYASEKGVSLLN